LESFSDHQQQPGEWTADRIAGEFKLKQENVNDILDQFRLFAVHILLSQAKPRNFMTFS
jgi:hypothetical protein